MSVRVLELEQIQGNIVPGFYKDAQDFLFVRFPDPATGRRWLAELVPRLSTAADIMPVNAATRERRKHNDKAPAPNCWINVAVSYAALRALDIPDIERFPPEFKRSALERAEQLGDAPVVEGFDIGGRRTEAHAVLLLGANTCEELNALQNELGVNKVRRKIGDVNLIAWQHGQSRGDGRENFGFLDGRSQPVPPNFGSDGWQSTPDGQYVAPGEFILGQPDEHHSSAFDEPEWARNGSYLVFRRFRQNVGSFEASLVRQAQHLPELVHDANELATKLMGRSREQRANPTVAEFAGDPLGDRCPLFSHVRKANPRDRQVDEPNRHRIIRRGITYGPHEDQDVGLLFVAYQASIARGFEHIATRWLATPTFVGPAPGLATEPGDLSALETPGVDPITAWTGRGTHRVNAHKPGTGTGEFIPVDLEQFVEVRGCGCFFAPSLKGITDMATEHELHANMLGTLIVDNMPYGDAVKVGSLESGDAKDLAKPYDAANPPDIHNLDVQVFGALNGYNKVRPLQVKVIPADEAGPYMETPHPNGVVVPADQNAYARAAEYGGQIFHVMLPNGMEHPITKGMLIPYKYTDVNGKPVYASIIVLYNGTGEPG
jgi:Dyp-type peroxidase family